MVDPVDDTICDAVKNLKKQLQPSLMMQEIFERSACIGRVAVVADNILSEQRE